MNLSIKHNSRLFLLLFFLLFFPPLSALAGSGSLKEQEPLFEIQVKDSLLTAKVKDISLKKVLDEIARQTMVKIVFFGPVEELVTINFNNIPLERGLKALIRGFSYALIYHGEGEAALTGGIDEILIFPGSFEAMDRGNSRIKTTMHQEYAGDQNETVLKSLFNALEDEYPPVREETVVALSSYKDERAFIYLTDVLLYDRDEDVRAMAAKALGDLGDKRAVAPLLLALQDKEGWVRENVADALGQIGEERVISSLLPALEDGSGDVQRAANDAIKRINKALGNFE